jgi:hypothetical protein
MIWQVIWVVFMIFWGVFGVWWGFSAAPTDRPGRFGGAFFPFICVLILGLIVFGAVDVRSGGTLR